MVRGVLSKSGEDYVVTISHQEVERLHLSIGQVVLVDVRPIDEEATPTVDGGDDGSERADWSRLAMRSLARDWDSEADRIYDRLS